MSHFATTARTATVLGREHLRLGRNNQDGVCVLSRGDVTVAVVTDGCSSQPFSEVGARLGARRCAQLALEDGGSFDTLAARVTGRLTQWIGESLEPLDGLEEFGLFTFLAAVQRGAEALVFGVGDGAVFVDGHLTRLDSGDDNAPPYLAYRLRGQPVEPQVHHRGPARRIALLTDGFDAWLGSTPEGLPSLLAQPLVWTNPAHLQRQLNVLHEQTRFADDATIAALDTRGPEWIS